MLQLFLLFICKRYSHRCMLGRWRRAFRKGEKLSWQAKLGTIWKPLFLLWVKSCVEGLSSCLARREPWNPRCASGHHWSESWCSCGRMLEKRIESFWCWKAKGSHSSLWLLIERIWNTLVSHINFQWRGGGREKAEEPFRIVSFKAFELANFRSPQEL